MTQIFVSAGPVARRMLVPAAFAATLALTLATPAAAHSDVTPYLEVQQVLNADVGGGGDVLTYTSVAAGIDGSITSRRVEAQVSYRYERRIPLNGHLNDEDVHSGLAEARIQVIPNVLTFEGGALATRSRYDSRGGAYGFNSADSSNIAQVYGVYGGPSLATHAGPVDINASYRIGYVHVDDQGLKGLPSVPGQPLDRYDSSTTQDGELSVGMGPGHFPVGWTVGAGYVREDTNRLKQTYQGKYVRGDLVLPITQTLAVTGGAGYEKIEQSQQDVARNQDGTPVVTDGGNFVADKTKPRLLAYDQSGLIWDAGVIWRPNHRTELQARVGQRYGGTTVTGSLQYKFNDFYAISAVLYNSVDSFGRLVIDDLDNLPVHFDIKHNALNSGIGGIGGCIFGKEPGSGACLDQAFQSISTSNFHNRGVGVLLSGGRGAWDFGLGFGYAQRRYIAPVGGGFFSVDGVTDESATAEAEIDRKLTRTSGINLEAYASWYNSGLDSTDDSWGTGITATYYRSFLLERLQAEAALGLYTTNSTDEDSTIASALLGLRYVF
jgi:hypothetical protein